MCRTFAVGTNSQRSVIEKLLKISITDLQEIRLKRKSRPKPAMQESAKSPKSCLDAFALENLININNCWLHLCLG